LFNIYSGHIKLLLDILRKNISDVFNILFKYFKFSDIDPDLHQRSPHGKDALVYEDHFPVEFLIISEQEPKILAFLVSEGGNLPKTLNPLEPTPFRILS
jgi:hypothetical protein